MTAEAQRANVPIAAQTIAPLVGDHELVISHGNGPQVGLLALQGAAYKPDEAYPLDVLGAETEGMIGYMIEQELGNVLPFEVPFATLLTMVEVDADDPGFKNPTKFVGPVYDKAAADKSAAEKGWTFKQDGDKWRRVVPSPLPKRIFEIRPIRWLLERKTIVNCAGGGGIPTMYKPGGNRKLIGVEAVIDKDVCSALLANELGADRLLMLTGADAVYMDWGRPTQRPIRAANPAALRELPFAAGSMARRWRPLVCSRPRPTARRASARSGICRQWRRDRPGHEFRGTSTESSSADEPTIDLRLARWGPTCPRQRTGRPEAG
jgi:carbamate kinase